jgi:hypothetical protein
MSAKRRATEAPSSTESAYAIVSCDERYFYRSVLSVTDRPAFNSLTCSVDWNSTGARPMASLNQACTLRYSWLRMSSRMAYESTKWSVMSARVEWNSYRGLY